MTSRNIPRLRFKKFKDEWNLESLEDNIRYVRGNNGDINDLPILTISAGNGWMNQKDRFGNVLAGKELKNYTLLKKYQLSYNHGNSKLAKFGAVFMLRDYDKALVPKVYHSFEMTKNNSPFFIENLFSSKIPDRQLGKLITSGARMDGLLNINKKAFSSIKLNFPSLPEQQHIGNFFSKLDHLIDLHSQKLEQLKKLKRGYLQKMFPQKDETVPRLRFSGFYDDWKNVKVSSICNREDNKRVAVKESQRKHGLVPYYGANGIQDYVNDFTHDGNYVLIAEDGAKSIINYPIYYVSGKIWVNNHAHVLSAKEGKSDIKFLASLFSNFNFYRYLVGGGRYKLNADILMSLEVKCPSISEQQKISKFLNEIDCLIEKSSDKVNELKRQKKAYLQKMFI